MRTLNRPVAVCLLGLMAVSVTAPFQRFDLNPRTSEAAIDAWPARELVLAASLVFAATSPSPITWFNVVPTFSGRSDRYRILPAVLRV